MLSQAVFNADKDHALLFQGFMNAVIDHLRFILCAHTSEELALGFRYAQLVESVLDRLRDIVPRFALGLRRPDVK